MVFTKRDASTGIVALMYAGPHFFTLDNCLLYTWVGPYVITLNNCLLYRCAGPNFFILDNCLLYTWAGPHFFTLNNCLLYTCAVPHFFCRKPPGPPPPPRRFDLPGPSRRFGGSDPVPIPVNERVDRSAIAVGRQSVRLTIVFRSIHVVSVRNNGLNKLCNAGERPWFPLRHARGCLFNFSG